MVEVRNFSGLVELPTPTTMDLTLRIQRQSADATPLLPGFFATLLAQETTSPVSGTFTVGTVPQTGGTVEGMLTSLSSLTAAGQLDAVFIEDSGNCTARQQYVGLIAAAGTNLAAGRTLQQCASASLAALSSISLTATGTVIEPAPDPGPDPVPGQVFTLTVVLAGSGSGTVASSPAGINCGSDCTETYPEGTAATLTPTSAAGSVFAGWSGDAACANGAVAMDVDHSCTATFNTSTRPSFTLTITVGGSGSGSVASNPGGITCGGDCTEDYTEGTVVTLTPTAAAGSIFGGWTGHPDCSDGQVTMNAARHRTATFDVSTAPTKTLTVTRAGTGSGTVTSSPGGISCGGDCSEDYREGTAVTLIPTANAGSTFVGWSGAVDCSDGSVTTSPAGVNCGAGCTESYEEGTIVTLIHNPAGGSTFAGWSGGADCVDGSVTMNGTRSCIATFDLVPPNTLAVTVTGTGLGTVTSDVGGINCPGTCSERDVPARATRHRHADRNAGCEFNVRRMDRRL